MTVSQYPEPCLFVGGARIGTSARETISVIDPATGAETARLPMATSQDVSAAVDAASAAFSGWAETAPIERASMLDTVADGLRTDSERFARLIADDLGKPLPEARTEVETAAGIWQWNAEEARRLYGRLIPGRSPGINQQVRQEPVGPVFAVSPWNAPLITPSRKISGALAAGCTVVAKSAEETPAASVALLALLEEVGVPAGAVNLLFGDPVSISAQVLDDPRIRALTFTGSTRVGKILSAHAMKTLKKVTMELGGHAPVLVFADADIEAVAGMAVKAKFRNAGQICTSPTRFLVEEAGFDRFTEAFTAGMAALKVGDSREAEVSMGPLASAVRVTALSRLVEDARSLRLRVECGDAGPGGSGFYHAPTAVIGATPEARGMNEEPFGPLALLARFGTEEEAMAEANRLPVGLAAYAFTENARRAARVASGLRAGNVIINHFQASLPETPFGGLGDSGFGSEGGVEGLQAFTIVKYVSQV